MSKTFFFWTLIFHVWFFIYFKFREFGIAWKATLLVTSYIRVKRGCAGINHIILLLPGGQYIAKIHVWKPNRYSLPRWKGGEMVPVRGHPLLCRVCTSVLPYGQALRGVLIVLPSRQFLLPKLESFTSSPLLLRYKSAPKSVKVRFIEWAKNGTCIDFGRELHGNYMGLAS